MLLILDPLEKKMPKSLREEAWAIGFKPIL